MFYDAFSQDIFLGHMPYNCAFCPGPALPESVRPRSARRHSGGAITAGAGILRVLADQRFLWRRSAHSHPLHQNFNLNVQQQVGQAVFQIGYVGAKGTKLFRFRDINQPSQAQITAFDTSTAPGGQCFGLTAPNCPIGGFDGPDGVNFNVPRTAFPNFFYVNQEESTAGSTYHALQTSLRMNSWHGLTAAANFAWSHSIDDASDSEDFVPNAAQPNNSLAASLDRGNSNFDIRRRFSWNFGYEFPKMNGNWSRLKNGWGVDGIVNLQDGQPYQLNYNFEGDYSGSGEGFDRPDVVGPVRYGSGPFGVDLSSFQVPCTFGNTTGLGAGGDSDCWRWNSALRRYGAQLAARSRFQRVKFLYLQEHGDHRARDAADPGRVLQPVQSP